MRAAADNFSGIPIGDTSLDLEESSMVMPEKMNINYDERIVETPQNYKPEVKMGIVGQSASKPAESITVAQPEKKSNIASLLDDDDDVTEPVKPNIAQPPPT